MVKERSSKEGQTLSVLKMLPALASGLILLVIAAVAVIYAVSSLRADGPLLNMGITYPSRGVGVTATLCMPQTNGKPCPVVVLAHGFGGDKNCGGGFKYIAEALYNNGTASIRIDSSGCGDSGESSTKYCLTEMRTDIANAISHMVSVYNVDSARVGLLGYSMGGRAVLETLVLEDCGHAYGMYSGSGNNQYIASVIQFALRLFK